jgi:hypothetical protein
VKISVKYFHVPSTLGKAQVHVEVVLPPLQCHLLSRTEDEILQVKMLEQQRKNG